MEIVCDEIEQHQQKCSIDEDKLIFKVRSSDQILNWFTAASKGGEKRESIFAALTYGSRS